MASIFQSFPQPQPQPQQTQQQNTAKKQSGLDISFLNLIYNTPQLFNNNMTTTTTMIGTSQDDDATVPTQEVVHLNYSERQPQNNFFSGQTITVTDNSGNVPRYSTSSTGSFSSLFNNSLGGGNSASPGTSGNNNNVWDNAGLNNALFSSLAANLSNNNNNNKDFDGSDNLLLNLANNELRTPTDVGSFSDIADLLSMTRGSEDDIVPDLDLMGLSQIGDNFRFPDLLGAPEGGKLKQELEAAKSRVMELENSLKKIHTTTTTTTPAGNNNSGLFNGPSLKVEDIPLLSPNSAAAAAAAAAILSNPALANSSLAAQLAALAPLAGLNFFNNNSSSSMLDVNNNNNSNPLNLFQSQQQHHHQQQQQQQQQQQAQPAPNNRTTPSPTMNNSADGSNNNSSSSFADNLSENAIIFPDRIQIGKLTIGKYTKKEREARIERYKEKRRNRCFVKKIRYQCRKKLADSRPRYKGRFCKEPPKPEQTTPELSNFSDDDDNNSNSGDCSNLIIPTMAHLSTSPSPAAESGSAPAEINNSNSNSNQQKSDQKRKKQAPAGTTTTTTTTTGTTTDNIKSNIKLPTKP